MNKLIVFFSILMGLFGSSAFAVESNRMGEQPKGNGDGHHQKFKNRDELNFKEPKFEMSSEKFNELKQMAIGNIDKRIDVLNREKSCVSAATERQHLKKCLQEAQEYRKNMMNELREKRKNLR